MYDFNLLKSLYEIHSPSGQEKKLRKFVKRIATLRGGECVQDQKGNLYVTKGVADTYPCICAHLDQVQKNHSKDFRVFKDDDIIFAYSAKSKSMQGLGADDKNGIWIALELLERLDVLKCAFFVGEEIGCVGSSEADMEFFKDVRYCIQPDRRNGDDLITNISGDICSQDFLDAIDYGKFGYKETTGLMTDVEELCEKGVGVSCINISCGYYNPHTDEECTSWSELCNAFEFALHICIKLVDVYPHKYESIYKRYNYGGYGNYNYYRDYCEGSKGKSSNYGGRYTDWYDDWECDEDGVWHKKGKAKEYTKYDEDEDYEMMNEILESEPYLTFEEVVANYDQLFICTDKDILRYIYEDTIEAVKDVVWNSNTDKQVAKQQEFNFAECG